MPPAVLELDALADTDRPRPDDQPGRGHSSAPGLVLLLPRRVVVGRGGLELGGAGVHELVSGTARGHRPARNLRDGGVSEAGAAGAQDPARRRRPRRPPPPPPPPPC